MRVVVLAASCAAIIGFGAAWYAQGLRWSNDVQSRDLAIANAISANVAAIAAKREADRVESEKIRAAYLDYKKGAELEISDLERRVSAGPERLYIKANCPAVPAAGADAGRAGSGAAELSAETKEDYFSYERAYNEQFSNYRLCWAELKKRSAP